jgi:hypothetical protein
MDPKDDLLDNDVEEEEEEEEHEEKHNERMKSSSHVLYINHKVSKSRQSAAGQPLDDEPFYETPHSDEDFDDEDERRKFRESQDNEKRYFIQFILLLFCSLFCYQRDDSLLASQLLESRRKGHDYWSDETNDDNVVLEDDDDKVVLNPVSTPKAPLSKGGQLQTNSTVADSLVIPPSSSASPPPSRSMKIKENLSWKDIPEFSNLKQRKRLASVTISGEVNQLHDPEEEGEEGEEEMEYFPTDPADDDYSPQINFTTDASISK